MSARRSLGALVALALLCAASIIGMLVTESPLWDTLFFVLAALPLLIGGWRAWSLRATPPQRAR